MIKDYVKEQAIETASNFIQREGVVGWLLVVLTAVIVVIVVGGGLLLYELRAVNLDRIAAERKLYDSLVATNKAALKQEQDARDEFRIVHAEATAASERTATALETLAGLIRDRRQFDALVFNELKRGTDALLEMKTAAESK